MRQKLDFLEFSWPWDTCTNKILENDESDMIAMARAFLSNPRWVWDAADILGVEIETPNQYARRFKKSI